MTSLLQSIQQRLASSRERRELQQFGAELYRLINRPGKAFTLGMTNIRPHDIQIQMPEKLDLTPIPGNYGVAEVLIPCTIGASNPSPRVVAPRRYSTWDPRVAEPGYSARDDSAQFWLQVKTVDGMITSIFITETKPYHLQARTMLSVAEELQAPEVFADFDAPR